MYTDEICKKIINVERMFLHFTKTDKVKTRVDHCKLYKCNIKGKHTKKSLKIYS